MNAKTVAVYSAEQVLDSGWPVSETTAPLYEGPARVVSPTRPWEKAAALEGIFDSSVQVHTATNLNTASSVLVDGQVWRVVSISQSAYQWRLDVRRREVA